MDATKKRNWLRAVLLSVVALMLSTGCAVATPTPTVTPSAPAHSSTCGICDQLRATYPWLGRLGQAVLTGLVQEYGDDVAAILLAALGLM
jgi:hypothetical protein